MTKTNNQKSLLSLITLVSCFLLLAGTLMAENRVYDSELQAVPDNDPAFRLLSVSDVYADETITDGDSVLVFGYYTNPDHGVIVDFPLHIANLQVLPPHSSVMYAGDAPGEAYWDGGYVAALGVIEFVANTTYLWPEDSIMAIITVSSWMELRETPAPEEIEKNQNGHFDRGDGGFRDDCDDCKFAVLIGGGYSSRPEGNFEAIWLAIEELFQLKKNELGYCEDNIFVNYWNGTSENTETVPQARVSVADSSAIAASHEEISRRVAQCHEDGKPVSFQKLIVSHGYQDGSGFALFDNTKLLYSNLRDMQQKIIDSCATTIKDEFLQCFGGAAVDEMKQLDTKNKATIYANSASPADLPTWVNPGATPAYLAGKITALSSGTNYPDAVVQGKLSYDDWLENTAIPNQQQILEQLQEALEDLVENEVYFGESVLDLMAGLEPPINEIFLQDVIDFLVNDLNEEIARTNAILQSMQNAICKSRNITMVPFTKYCEWVEFVVPPGGQLVLDFDPDSEGCGSVTVYRENEILQRTEKVAEWNRNVPGSDGFEEGNQRRVINGDPILPTRFILHSDSNEGFVVTAEATANQDLDESPSNPDDKPGFSFGGNDGSSEKFYEYKDGFYYLETIDRIPISLDELPARMGSGFVDFFGFDFSVNPDNIYWTQMELVIDVAEVFSPGTLMLFSEGIPDPLPAININDPGRYYAYIGDMTQGGGESGFGSLFMAVPEDSELDFSFDAWGLRSLYEPPLFLVEFFIMDQDGEPIHEAIVDVEGHETFATDVAGLAYTYITFGEYTATISKEGYESFTMEFFVESDVEFEITLMQSASAMVFFSIFDQDGAPVSEAQIMINEELFLFSDEWGFASVELFVGFYIAEISKAGHEFVILEFVVEEGQDFGFEILLPWVESFPPIIFCPPDLTVPNDFGLCSALDVDLGEPIVEDTSGDVEIFNNAPADGFPVGTTIVTWTVVNAAGQSSSCEQLVTVEDVEPPVVPNIPDIEIIVDHGTEHVLVPFDIPDGLDNCGVVTSSSSHTSPALVIVGTTLTVTTTWIDFSSNKTSRQFTISARAISCPDDLYLCQDDDPIDLMNLVEPQGGTFTGGQIYDPSTKPPGVPVQVQYNYVDPHTGQTVSCIFYITVLPAPIVECHDGLIVLDIHEPIDLEELVSPPGGMFPNGAVFDPSEAGIGDHVITYEYTDPETGCIATCEIIITVEPFEFPPVFLPPPDMLVDTDPGKCHASAVTLAEPVVDDPHGLVEGFVNDAPDIFPVGITSVTWIPVIIQGYTITVTGITSFVTVKDNEPPQLDPDFTLPPFTTNPGECSWTVDQSVIWIYLMEGVTDNCGIAEVTIDVELPQLPPGDHTINVTASDVNGNSNTFDLFLRVNDIEGPEINDMPDNKWIEIQSWAWGIHQYPVFVDGNLELQDSGEFPSLLNKAAVDPGTEGTFVFWDLPEATDNCGVESLTGSHEPGDFFTVGTTEVVYTAVDVNGNVTQESFTVTVVIIDPPDIPDIEQVTGVFTAADGEICFAALQTIHVSDAVFEPGAQVNLVAGASVLFSPGIHIQAGAHVHASIDQDGTFCGDLTTLVTLNEEDLFSDDKANEVFTGLPVADIREMNTDLFRAYPNPTDGRFTLELIYLDSEETINVQVFGLYGASVFHQTLPAKPWQFIDLTGHQPGVYFIRVIMGDHAQVERVIIK